MVDQENDDLNKTIGTLEGKKLKPVKVLIRKVEIEPIEKAKAKKVICTCIHPESDEPIIISQVKYENKKNKLVPAGLWVILDEEKHIFKESALAILMKFLKCDKIKDLEGKESDTVTNEDGYLCLKAY